MLTKSTVATNNISLLNPEPNDVQGLTDAELQAKFDQYGIDNNTFINNVLTVEQDAVNTSILSGNLTIDGVKTFSSSPIVPEPTLVTQTASKGYVDTTVGEVILGVLSDGSITDVKLSNDPTQIKGGFAAHLAETATLADVTNTNDYVFNSGSNITLQNNKLYKFMCTNASIGNVTIKVDSNAVLPLKNPNTGTQLGAGKVKALQLFQAWYSSASSCFFYKASTDGTAVAANVLAGTTFSNDSDTGIPGTMPNKVGAGIVINPSTLDQIIQQGYYDGTIGSGKVSAITMTAGVNSIYSLDVNQSINTTSPTKMWEVTANYKGSIRISFNAWYLNSGGTAYARVYVNGVAVGTQRTITSTSSPGITYTEDITVNVGDKIQIYGWVTNASVYTHLGVTTGSIANPNYIS